MGGGGGISASGWDGGGVSGDNTGCAIVATAQTTKPAASTLASELQSSAVVSAASGPVVPSYTPSSTDSQSYAASVSKACTVRRAIWEKVTLQLPSIPLKSPTGRAQTSHAFAGSGSVQRVLAGRLEPP